MSESDGGPLSWLLLPVTWPGVLLVFALNHVKDTIDRELYDPKTLEKRLIEARLLYELGEMSEEDYDRLESQIVQRLTELEQAQEESW